VTAAAAGPGARSSRASGVTGELRPAHVQAVSRTMEALELIADAPDGLTVAELTLALGVDKSVGSRILSTLNEHGYLVRDGDSDRHELSLKLLALTARHANRIGFPKICQPVLQSVTDATGELAQLSVVERDRLVLVAHSQQTGRQRLTILPDLGTVQAPHTTSSGKAWLASMSDEQALQIALKEGLRPLTARTITRVDELLAELERVRADGYGIVEDEAIEGISAVAFAIGTKRFGRAVGTIALSAPSSRTTRDKLVGIAPVVEHAAAQLEAIWPEHVVRLAAPVNGGDPSTSDFAAGASPTR
jgi:IclR family acetate operon transcriptional repressor